MFGRINYENPLCTFYLFSEMSTPISYAPAPSSYDLSTLIPFASHKQSRKSNLVTSSTLTELIHFFSGQQLFHYMKEIHTWWDSNGNNIPVMTFIQLITKKYIIKKFHLQTGYQKLQLISQFPHRRHKKRKRK